MQRRPSRRGGARAGEHPGAFERAVELGVDLIELDVLDLADGTLVLAHSNDLHEVSHGAAEARAQPEPRALRESLRSCRRLTRRSRSSPSGARPSVSSSYLNRRGIEAGVVETTHRDGVLDRAGVSSFDAASLRPIAELAPERTRSTPCRGIASASQARAARPGVLGAVASLGAAAPPAAGRMSRARATAATLHHAIVSKAAIDRAH